MSAVTFSIKTICWSQYEQRTPILLQEENGPCPLLAIVNTLLLQADIGARTSEIDNPGLRKVVDKTRDLRNVLLACGDRILLDLVVETLANYLQQNSDLDNKSLAIVVSHLPSLIQGLDVDINLITGTCSTEGLAHMLFQGFGLEFTHGWCREPYLGLASDAVFEDHQTYDKIQDFLLKDNSRAAFEIREWLDKNSTQLTDYGLQVMDKTLRADLVSVFFRNNHFSTLYKGANHGFYLLITDRDFSAHENYVWQSLNSISGGEDLFFTGDLTPLIEEGLTNERPEDTADRRFAAELQEQEDIAMAKRLQQKYDEPSKNASRARKPSDKRRTQQSSKKLQNDPKEEKNKTKGCVIV